MLAGKVPTKPDRQRIVAYQGFHLKRRVAFPQPNKVVAYFHRHREIDLVNMLGALSCDNDACCNNGAKVEQDQAGPDFLLDVLHLFRMETGGANRMFKVPE